MLVLSRKFGEEIIIGDDIRIEVTGISPGSVRLGITAPKGVRIDRAEVRKRLLEGPNPSSNPC